MQRLREKYIKEIAPVLRKELELTNPMAVPKITSVVVNVGVGKNFKDQKQVDAIAEDLAKMTGQIPVRTKSRLSIAGFKVREGAIVGLKVTLRGDRAYSFLDKLINVAFPRTRDFRGIKSSGFDGRGNFHLGLKEQLIFPEVPLSSVSLPFGLQISVVTTAKDDESAKKLLTYFGFPFTN